MAQNRKNMYLTGPQITAISEFADGTEIQITEIREPHLPGIKINQFSTLLVKRIEDDVKVRVDQLGRIEESPGVLPEPKGRKKPEKNIKGDNAF